MTTIRTTAERLIALSEKATPQEIDTAQIVDKDETITCPWCDGEGSVDADTFTNYDECAIGVQFFGVGNEFGNAEEYFRACKPQTITRLAKALIAALDVVERAKHLCGHPKYSELVMRDALNAFDLATAEKGERG